MSADRIRHDMDFFCNHALETPIAGGVAWCPTCKVFRHVGADKPRETHYDFPRRNRVYEWVAAEHAISNAVAAVEGMGADVRLTDAVILLGRAQGRVADFVDGIPNGEEYPRAVKSPADEVIAAVLAEVARQDAGKNDAPNQGEYLRMELWRAANAIREALRLNMEGA